MGNIASHASQFLLQNLSQRRSPLPGESWWGISTLRSVSHFPKVLEIIYLVTIKMQRLVKCASLINVITIISSTEHNPILFFSNNHSDSSRHSHHFLHLHINMSTHARTHARTDSSSLQITKSKFKKFPYYNWNYFSIIARFLLDHPRNF